jgi:hypothetical protein
VSIENRPLGVPAGDHDVNLVGAVALDHRGRVGWITGTRREGGVTFYTGLELERVGHWRWTAARPLVIAGSVKEYWEATDELLGLEALRGKK